MLETIMKLNIPLYVMTSMGCIGGLGMLATNLTYRRMIRNTQRLQNLKEKWLNLWKSRDRLWHRICVVSVTVLYISSWNVCFSQQQTGI